MHVDPTTQSQVADELDYTYHDDVDPAKVAIIHVSIGVD